MSQVTLRDVARDDAAHLARITVRNRADIEATDPPRAEAFYTVDGQVERIQRVLGAVAAGELRFFVILVDGAVIGDIGIEGIQRGPVLSGRAGYLVDREHRGRGIATEALRRLTLIAFGEMGLHRLEAGVLVSNVASQRVLEKAGFRRVGLVERNLFVAGRWQDNYLYELVGPHVAPAGGA